MAKILHLIPTLEGGGAERQLAMLANVQANRGWGVHIALRRSGPNQVSIRKGEVSLHSLGDLRGPHPQLVLRVVSLVRRIEPDVVQTWLPQMDIVGGLAALFSRCSWILSERSARGAYQGTPLVAWLRQRIGKHASAIVANSPEGAAYWAGCLPAMTTIWTVSNAVDIAAIRSAAPMPCQLPDAVTRTLLFVGRLVTEKAPEILIEALSRIAQPLEIQTLIIGDGPFREPILARISAHGLDKHVRVLPYQSNWWGLLKTATALVSTSRFEGQPNVVLEAMAAGCPVIVSDIPAHRAILDNRSALIVPRDDPAALADAIVSLLSDPEAARRRAERASARVAGFTIQAAADAYERVYAKFLNGRVA